MTTLENLISLSRKSHILANVASLAHGLIGSTSGNTPQPYLDAIFPVLIFSSDSLINDFAQLFRNRSHRLHQ